MTTRRRRNTAQSTRPWDQQPREPSNWYHRFTIYRDLGPERTFIEVYRIIKGDKASPTSKKTSALPEGWTRAIAKWEWRDRVKDWDDECYAEAEHKVRRTLERKYIDALDVASQVDLASLRKALELIGLPAVYKALEETNAAGTRTVRAGVMPIAHYRGSLGMAEDAVRFIERLTGRRTDPDLMGGLNVGTPSPPAGSEPTAAEMPMAMRDMAWLREMPEMKPADAPGGNGNGNGHKEPHDGGDDHPT